MDDGIGLAEALLGLEGFPDQPLTSATTWAVPALLKRLTFPPPPILTVTRLGTVWAAAKFRLEASGRGSPAGQAVRNRARWAGSR